MTMTLPISPGTYEIDTLHSQLGFSVTHLGLSLVRGTFDSYRGSLSVGQSLDTTTVEVEADMKSVASGHPMREEYLQGEDFFHSAEHPTMTFRSTGLSELADAYELGGDMTIRGVTRPVTFAVTYNGSAIFPLDGSTHYGFSAEGTILRSDFGLSTAIPIVTDEVDIQLEVQFVEPAE